MRKEETTADRLRQTALATSAFTAIFTMLYVYYPRAAGNTITYLVVLFGPALITLSVIWQKPE